MQKAPIGLFHDEDSPAEREISGNIIVSVQNQKYRGPKVINNGAKKCS